MLLRVIEMKSWPWFATVRVEFLNLLRDFCVLRVVFLTKLDLMSMKSHWQDVYMSKAPDQVSWYQGEPTVSLDLIKNTGVAATSALIDVGGGASRLVDSLLDAGWTNLSVVDISAAALQYAGERLGKRAEGVNWIEADITKFDPPQRYSIWHDRALFHFLTDPSDRRRYVATLDKALTSGGHALIATFAPEGPPKCSGLDVVRYDAGKLLAELGAGFELKEERREAHSTPWGAEQDFAWFRFKKVNSET